MAVLRVGQTGDMYWSYWVGADSTTAGTAISATTMDGIWPLWITASTSTATTAYTSIYTGTGDIAWAGWARQREQTAAERQAEEARRAQWAADAERRRQEEAVREQERVAAKARARETLLAMLSPSQRAEYEAGGHFSVLSPSGRRYKLLPKLANNIIEFKGSQPHRTWCVHPNGVPLEDQLLTQKLALECGNEAALEKISNIHEFRRGEMPLAALG